MFSLHKILHKKAEYIESGFRRSHSYHSRTYQVFALRVSQHQKNNGSGPSKLKKKTIDLRGRLRNNFMSHY